MWFVKRESETLVGQSNGIVDNGNRDISVERLY